MFDRSFGRRAWHGPILKGSLKGITIEQALWRPAPKRHNIWEIMLHCAFWMFAVRRSITGIKAEKFSRKGFNWPALPKVTDKKQWKKDVALLTNEYQLLRKTLENISEDDLWKVMPKSKTAYFHVVYGISYHNIYHAGQIQLLKCLQKG